MSIIFSNPNEYSLLELKPLINSKILSVDIGTKKHGVAISSTNMKFSYPLQVVLSYKEIHNIFKENNCNTLLVGYPFYDKNDIDSPESLICKIVDNFVKEFATIFENSVIIYVDENFSSTIVANQIKKQSGYIDSNVAAYLLNEFLEKLTFL